MPRNHNAVICGFLSILATSQLNGQEDTYDLWLCLERCDETNRASLAYTLAELVLSTATLSLDSVPSEQGMLLNLAEPGRPTVANGCILTHVQAGRVFRPDSDVFSLLKWTRTGPEKIIVEAPQEPFTYSLELSFVDGISGTGRSGDEVIYVSGAARAAANSIRCADLAALVNVR